MTNVAAQVRISKEKYPADYCADKKCLWRIVTSRGPNPCPKHPAPTPTASPALTESR